MVSTPDGGLAQIGRNCLADYLRNAEYAERFLSFMDGMERIERALGEDDGDDSWDGGSREYSYAVVSIVALAIVATREYGYISKKMAETQEDLITTSARIALHLEPLSRVRIPDPTPADLVEAEEIVSHLAGIVPNGDYEHNLKTLAELGHCTQRQFGYVASMPAHINRERDKAAKAAAPRTESQWVGEVGKKLTIDLTVRRAITVEGYYGVSYIYRMTDANGNVVVWKTATADLSEGDHITLTAKVDAHEVYRDERQTRVKRPTYNKTHDGAAEREAKAAGHRAKEYEQHVQDAEAELRAAEDDLAQYTQQLSAAEDTPVGTEDAAFKTQESKDAILGYLRKWITEREAAVERAQQCLAATRAKHTYYMEKSRG